MRSALLLPILALALGCGESSSARRCEPTDNTGCPSGQHCTVDRDGAPVCLAPAPAYVEGAACEGPEDCGEGLGCLRVLGVARCLRFCVPDTEAPLDPCADGYRDADEGGHPLTVVARCLATLVRPGIGACTMPCRPEEATVDCPEGAACRVEDGLEMPLCGAAGDAELDNDCSAERPCRPGLFCAPRFGGGVCRPPADAEGRCADQASFAQVLPGALHPLTGGDLLACVACAPIGYLGTPAAGHVLCAAVVDAETAEATCAAQGGGLADLRSVSPAALVAATARAGGTPRWIAARREDGAWQWADGEPLTEAPAGEGASAAVDADAAVVARPCTAGAHPACALAP